MKNNMLTKSWLLLIAGAAMLWSCGTPKGVVYFQDLQAGDQEIPTVQAKVITVQPDDKISIIVNSRDRQLTDMFNLPYVPRLLGRSTSGSTSFDAVSSNYSQTQGVSGYTVDSDGYIDFPVLGKVYVAGLTRGEIASEIKDALVSGDLVKDPVVTVEFLNLSFSVMGEVNNPGRYMIDRDRVTILDAISMAGDLTINGERSNVMVQRMEGDDLMVYTLDLTSGLEVYNSPAFYLQQNDLVYVTPNDVRIRQSTVNGNNIRSTSFWISIGSLLTSVAVLVTNIIM